MTLPLPKVPTGRFSRGEDEMAKIASVTVEAKLLGATWEGEVVTPRYLPKGKVAKS